MEKINFDRGLSSEALVPWALENAKHLVPEWFRLPVEHAKMKLDFNYGIDYIVYTDIGKIYLQVKSSERRAQIFRAKYAKSKYANYTALIVIDAHVRNAEEIAKRIVRAVEKIRNNLCIKRGQPELVTMVPEPSV